MVTPEQKARQQIDKQLEAAGWMIQDRDEMNLSAARGVAIREFKMERGFGFADYLLFVDGKAVGALEAKKAGHTLTGVEIQVRKYGEGLSTKLKVPVRPLPFLLMSTGSETRITNRLDPEPRSREIFAPPRPETLTEWLQADTLTTWIKGLQPSIEGIADPGASYGYPSTLRGRLRHLPPPEIPGLWPNQLKAITGLEKSLGEDRPRALIQMATGSGKSLTSVVSIYRLIKYGGARRVLFLVDRSNLGIQAESEFVKYRTYDDNRKFNELYNVQRLQTNTIGSSTKVVITTVQRLYSMLKGEVVFDPESEDGSAFETAEQPSVDPLTVEYNPAIPPEYFDIIFVDECHRSIYSLWRQVLEYFDAHIVGLTATPAKHTFGFFNQNLVMEYNQEMAVADGVNVDFDIYRIRTKITQEGSKIEASSDTVVGMRDRLTRRMRWERPDEDVVYGSTELDKRVVAKDQIRLIIRTFKERLAIEIFPGRQHVPKTLIFAKDDSHAEDIVGIVREEFGKGNDFCRKITYKVTNKKPQELIQEFRTSYNPRIAVTVDMISTGTDVRPIEIVMFMRTVKSRVLYEQMKGRGGRVSKSDEMRSVTPDAKAKTHFVLIDCVGVTETEKQDTRPLDQKRTVPFKEIMEHVAQRGTDVELVSSLVSRLTRLRKNLPPESLARIEQISNGTSLDQITHDIAEALDIDNRIETARQKFKVPDGEEPTSKEVQKITEELISNAVKPLATKPKLRGLILDLKRESEQIIDEISRDELDFAGSSPESQKKAQSLVQSFEQYIIDNKDEIDALQFFYSQPYNRRLRYDDIKALADTIQSPPRHWTAERLWNAYEKLNKDKVRGAAAERLLTDIVSLVRFALHKDNELVPFAEQVYKRFENWLSQQTNKGRRFNDNQMRWLYMIRDHIARSYEIEMEDFDLTPFVEEGGLGKAGQVFGKDLAKIISELNEVLAA